MKYGCYFVVCLLKMVAAVCNNFCGDGLQPVLPSTVTLPPPDNTNSSFDQCNLMGGVYQCTYHPLFDCDPNIFYTWSTNDPNDLRLITADFSAPVLVQTINVMTQSPEAVPTVVSVEFDSRRAAGSNTTIQSSNIMRRLGFGGGNRNFTGELLQSELNQINITIGTSSTVTIKRIIICAANGPTSPDPNPSSSSSLLHNPSSISVSTTPSSSSSLTTASSDSHIKWIIIIVVLTVLLLVVTVLLVAIFSMYCHKVSVLKRMMADKQPSSGQYDTVMTPYLTPMIKSSDSKAVTLEHNPSYGGAQPKRRRQLDDTYDYVVTDGEMIETDHNPSYVTTTVGSSELQDNPSYQPAFLAVV